MNEKRKIKVETIVRTIMLIVALINQSFIMFGKNPLPFADEDIYVFLSTFITILTTLWAWWKNNSFTPEALEADEQLRILKEEKFWYDEIRN